MQCLNIVGKCSAFEAAPPSPENANYQQSSGVGFFTYLTAMRNGLLFGVYERQIRARATPAFFQFSKQISSCSHIGLISKYRASTK